VVSALLPNTWLNAHAQQPSASIVEAKPAGTPCCGVITTDGQRLIAVIDSLDVEHHWLAHEHVYWKTGEQDRALLSEHETHCSSFAAAVGYYLNVYLLRPPQHSIHILQGAQARWLISSRGREEGG
jgi:hypothetical protein